MILVHICCSVDSHYFLQRLQLDYPNEKIIGFFYDPNIHPYSEYKLRYFDVEYSCKLLGIKLIEGDYDYIQWLNAVKGYEDEPEKGARCFICFNKRLEVSAKKAIELKCDKFTSTLLISPKKSQEKLKIIGDALATKYNIKFIFKDYRSGNGTQIQSKEVKQNKIYRQDYCGCIYALTKQRNEQNMFLDEMISSVNAQILPSSIEEKIALYQKRNKLIDNGIDFRLIKKRFLNYRLLQAKVIQNNQTIHSYFLAYSTMRKKYIKAKVDFVKNNIFYFNKFEIKMVTLQHFNNLLNTNYQTIQQLYFSPPSFEDEIKFRNLLGFIPFFLSFETIFAILFKKFCLFYKFNHFFCIFFAFCFFNSTANINPIKAELFYAVDVFGIKSAG